jgi:hypothetical protein
MYHEVHTLVSATLRWSGVEAKAPQTPRRPHRVLHEPSHQKGSYRSTKGPLRAVTNP